MTVNNNIDKQVEKKAETVVDKVQDTAEQASDEAKAKLSETTNAAKNQAKRMAGQVGETAKSTVESRKGDVAHEISSVADVVRQTTHEVGAGTSPAIENYGRRIADGLEGISSYMNENQVEDFLADAEAFGRRNPVVLLGGAFMLGLVVGRFLRSSAPTSAEDYGYGYDRYQSGTTATSYRSGTTTHDTGGYSSTYQPGTTRRGDME